MSTSTSEKAAFLALLAGYHRRHKVFALDSKERGERCRELNSYGILSLSAIGSVLGCSPWQVEQAILGHPRPTARGKLNPRHLSMLGYVVSYGKITNTWLRLFLEEGTSISTISDLTGIGESTLRRRKKNLG